MLAIPRSRFYLTITDLFKAFFSMKSKGLEFPISEKERFHKEMAHELNRDYLTTFSSCRMSLYFGLKELELERGDEVLLSPITIPDIVNAIITQGLIPVFVDMDPETHSICLEDLQRKISPRSKVVLVTYLSGISPDLKLIDSFCSGAQLTLVEDFSQGYGGRFLSKKLGSFGHFSVGSLTSGKNVGSFIGGIFTTNRKDLFNRVCQYQEELAPSAEQSLFTHYIKDHLVINLATSRLFFQLITFPYLFFTRFIRGKNLRYLQLEREVESFDKNNDDIFCDIVAQKRESMPREFFFKYSPWQASVARSQYKKMYLDIEKRMELADHFFSSLTPKIRDQRLLRDHADKSLNTYYHIPFKCGSSPYLFTDFMLKSGIDCTGYGLNLCSHEPAFIEYRSSCPNAVIIKEEVIFIPIHESFSLKDMAKIASSINQYYSTEQ